jgi:hypothetical protein
MWTIIINMTRSNATSLIGAPSDAAAFNVQGSTMHHLLGIGVFRPEDIITQKVQDKLQSQLKNVLCLIIMPVGNIFIYSRHDRISVLS